MFKRKSFRHLALFLLLLTATQLTACSLAEKIWTEKEYSDNPADYALYAGAAARSIDPKKETPKVNTPSLYLIFPENLPPSAEVEKFVYYYYNPWDPNYLVHLVYQCSKTDFEAECKRLAEIPPCEDYNYYGVTGFPYTLEAVIANSYEGFTYCLSDAENNRLIYLQIFHYNYFTDIDYTAYVEDKYLPLGYDARLNNPYAAGMSKE